jgi:hypothetical protein
MSGDVISMDVAGRGHQNPAGTVFSRVYQFILSIVSVLGVVDAMGAGC